MKTFNFKNAFTLLMLLMLVFGCVTFPKKIEISHYLSKANMNALNGKYNIEEIYSGPTKDTTSSWNFSNSDLGHIPTFYDEFNNGIFTKLLNRDSSNIYTFTLKILNTKKIEINYFENDIAIARNILRYKLKDDGYVYLKNKNFKLVGIPYVFGGFSNKRNRLTLNNDNNLLFETSEFRSGGLFLLMVNPYSKMKYEKIYERME
tara:strand:+ start:1180 stop:1791 length:612 start_codon:yes stop_codon:yes gene_type:complete